MLLEDYPRARWRDIRLGERHRDASSTHPPLPIVIFSDEREGDGVARGLHFDAMQPDAGIGHGGAITSKAASKPVGSVKSWDIPHSFAAFQSELRRVAWNATISILPTSAVR